MQSRLVTAACTFALLAAAGVAVEPGQLRPGEMTKAEVWIRNDRSEAVPVTVAGVHLDQAVPVFVTNGDGTSPPVRARLAPTVWAYRSVVIRSSEDAATALAGAGLEGWETTGIAWPVPDGTRLLLKRPR